MVRKYLECAQKSGFMVISRCREENFAQQECVAKWMNDQDLIKKVTDQYLEDRSYYRKTGIPVHSVLLEKHKIKLSDLPED